MSIELHHTDGERLPALREVLQPADEPSQGCGARLDELRPEERGRHGGDVPAPQPGAGSQGVHMTSANYPLPLSLSHRRNLSLL